MDKITKIKQAHPEWSTLSDSQLVDMVHQVEYPDLPKEQVARAFGVTLEAPKQPTAERKLFSLRQGSALNDVVTEFGNAVVGGVSSAANFVAPGNRVSGAIDKFIADSQDNLTPTAKQGKQQFEQELQQAEGLGEEAMAALRYAAANPGMALAQAAGSFVGPGAAIKGSRMAAKGLGLTEKAVTRAGLAAGSATGAAMAGGDAAGTAYDLVIKAGGTPEQAQAAAREASLIPAAIGGVGGLVGAERVFSGAKGFTGNAASRALKTGAVEGAQEGIEEGVTQYEGQRAAVPFDPTINPMKGVGGAATMGAVLGGATGGGISLLEGKVQNNGPLSRGANLALDQIHREAQAARPGAPGLSPDQEAQAMSNIMAQGNADMQAIKQAGIRDKSPSPYQSAPAGMPAGDPLSQTAEPFDSLGDRIMTTRQTLDDEGNRDAIRSKFGQSALDEVLYYLNQADRPGQIPDQTRENMLAVAEEIISRSRLTPVAPTPAMGAGGFSPMARLGADVGLPQIGLDMTPTGVMRADAQGNVAAETNADVINTRQAQSEAKGRGGRGMDGQTPRDTMRGAGPGVMVGEGTLTTPERPTRQQSAAGPVPRLVYRPNGEPFKNQRAAVLEQRRIGGDVVPVDGGWAVQTQGEADDVRGGQTLPTAERPGPDGALDAVVGVGGNGRVPSDGGVAVNDGGSNAAVRDGDGAPSASAVAVGATGRGIGAALNEQAQPATPAAPKTQAPQEAADPRGAGQAGPGEQGGGVPDTGRSAVVQADGVSKTPTFLKTKTVPEMTDEELKQAQAFYGPNHKRAKTIEKEMAKRAPKVPAVAEPKPSAQAPLDEGKARKDDQEPVKARQAGEVVGEATEVSEPEALPAPETNEGAQDGQQVQGQAPAEKLSLSPLEAMTGKRIDADWVAFSEASDTLGIPRAEMPQIKDEHRGAMVNFLNARGIEHEQDEVAAASLKPTQAEFSPAKVAQAKAYEGGDRSILVSEDGRVVDGHHQWLAKLDAGDPVKVIQLMAPVREVLDQIKEFPSADQDQASAQDAEQQDDAQASQPEPEAKATEPQETPQVSEAEARKRLTWRDLGQSGGEKTWGLYYDDGEGRGMRYGTVSKFAGSRWSVDGHDGGKYEGLQPAKSKAEDLAVNRLRRDGYVTQEQDQQAATGGIAGATAGGSRSAPPGDFKKGALAFTSGVPRAAGPDLYEKQTHTGLIEWFAGWDAEKDDAEAKAAGSVALPSEYPTKEADASYSGISHMGSSRAKSDRDAFVKTVQSLYEDALPFAKTPRQVNALKDAIEVFKAEYLAKAKRVISVRSGTYSGFVAGRSGLNAKRANAGNSALDRALDEFSEWLKGASPKVRAAVDAAKSSQQIAEEQAEKSAKAAAKQARDDAFLAKLLNLDAAGEPIKLGAGTITKVNMGRSDGLPSTLSITGDGIIKGVNDKINVVPTLYKTKDALQAAVSRVKGASEASASPASKTPTVDRHMKAMEAVRNGEGSLAEYQASFAAVSANEDAVKAELTAKTKEELLRAGGAYFHMRYKGETKPDIIQAFYAELLEEYALGKNYGPNSYIMTGGGMAAHRQRKREALKALVEGQTQEDLDNFAKEIAERRAENKAEREAKQAAMANPQTLSDFRSLLNVKIRDGMTRAEAFLTLTPEQRVKYDELEAESTKESREAAKRAAKTAVRSAGQTTAGEIVATKHTRDGHDLWVVKLADRLSTDDYRTVLASAKRLGGSYSSFRGNGAIPGFQFRTPEAAQAFLKLAGGDTTEAQGLAEQRRDAFDDDRSQSAVERLREMADKLEERAQEALDRDRKTNTARRARFAAAADREAQEAKALAQTMRNIAQAIEEGRAKFLDGVRTRSQVELLRGRVVAAKQEELRAKHPSYADQEKRKGEPATAETADFAEFPTFSAFRSDLASLARQMLEVDGTKKLGQQLMSVADDVTDAYIEFAKKPENLHKLSTFSIRQGEDVKAAIFPNKDAAERAIRRSGLSDRAIVLAEKRGVNRIIMSPSEAMSRGVWTGDGDKRITLTADAGAALVQAIGRRGNKTNRLTVPWQFQTAHDRLNALKRIGIETPSEYRSALREFIGLQERAIVNKVRELELAMAGRKNDGLDFFPTPAEVADQMVAAADITPDMAVLEPSAGMGHIADRIREAGAEPEVIELDEDRRNLLQEKGYYLQPYRDFMEMEPRKFFTFGDVMRAPDGTEGIMHGGKGWSGRASLYAINEDGSEGRFIGWFDRDELVGVRHRGFRGNDAGGYDRIIMNPPFSSGRDIEHVMHAYDLLKPGGRIVAIMGESAFFNQSKKAEAFRQWLDDKGGTSEKLPAGSFMDPSMPVNTGVNARMVVIDKSDLASESPDGDTGFSRQGNRQNAAEQNALKALSENDDLFRLPKSDGMTVEDITADNDPGIKVKKLQGIPGRTEYQFTMPNGKTARMVVRPANPYGANTYGFDYVDGEASNVLDVRPGDNPEDVDADKEDVWIDVSLLSSGQDGARIYNIASTYAHNTGRIFIGDPAGLSDDALIRRPEQMLSSALKFGTTEHLAPHPRQITGDDRLGVPSLRWVYGDHIGNIKRLIDVNLKVAENAGLDEITFDPTDGSFRDSEGSDLGREGIQALAMGAGYGRAAGAGPDTLARGAVLRALLREEGGAGEGEVGGRDGLLARLVSVSATHDEATKRVFYSREGVDQPETGEGFRRQDAIAAIAHMDMVEDLVRQLTDGWKNAPEIVVLRSMEEAPEAVRRENDRQLANGATGEPEAFYHQGKAYLLASHMRSMNDVRRAVFHEVLGHLGMRGLYGTEIGEILDQVARARRADVEAKAKQYGLNMKNARDRQIAAEEWLAEIAQENPQLGFVRRAVAAIRSWLRRNVPALAKMRMTDDEIIRELIVPVQKFIKDGPPDGSMGLLPAFRRDRGFSRGEGQRVAVKRDESGERVYAAGGVSLVYPIESERLEVIPGPGQKVLNYVIMPTDSFDVLGNMEVLVENGEPVSILDINVDGRNKGVGAKAVGMLLAAHPTTDMNVSNIVPSAQGFWEKMGIPTQNREEGAAYDGTINHATYLDAQAGRGAQGVLAEDQGPDRQADTRAEGSAPQALGGEEVGFSRTQAAQQFTGKAREAVFDVKGATGNTLAHYRGMALQALGRRQLVDLYGDMLPQLKRYDDFVQRMDAEKNDSAAEADALADEWGRLDEKPVLGPAKYPGMERQLAELMHDATLAQIDPDKPLQRGDNPGQHAALRAKFEALSPNAQSVYRRARDMYEGHYAKVREAIQDRIMRSELGDSKKKAMIARMDADFFQKTKGVYFPLARFGKYVMVVKDADGNVVNVSRAETLNEAETTRNVLLREFDKAKGFVVTKVMKEAEFNRKQDIVGKGFVTDLFAVLDKQGVDDALRDAVSQLYLSSLPDLSWAKHGIHRKGTPGFSQDARRAFAQNVFHGARYLAKLRYSDQMQNEIKAMGDHIKAHGSVDDYDGVKAQQVLDEMVKRHDNLMSPETNSVSTALTSLGYVWFMGLSPAAAMVNLSQTALVAYPVMGAKWGYGKAGAALLRASKEAVQAKNDISKVLKGDELEAYNRAVADGTIDVTMAHDLAGISQGDDAKVTWALRPVMKVASFMFHHAERFNRQTTFIASYRLAKESGAGFEAAFEQAKKATYDGHFDYSASNRPRIMQGNVARVVFLFKQYGQNMIYTMSRQAYLATQSLSPKERSEARKQLGGMLALHAAAAGALGLPLVGALLSAASFVGSDDDEPWDAEVALKNAMADAMGPKAAEVMAHGLSRLTPWDLSGRVALNKLILPDVQEGLEGQRWAEAMSSAMLGPVWGIVSGMAKGLQEMGEGRYQRGLENMLPVALRNPVKALRYQEEGAIDKTGVAIKDEVSAAGVIGQASGFSPSEVRAATEVKSAIFQHDRARMDRRSSLMAQFAQAQMAGDADALPEIRKAIAAFNAKNPERRITPRQLRQSVRNRERRIEESDKGIYLPKNRRDSIEAVRFGE